MSKLTSLIRQAAGEKRFNTAVILAAGNGSRMSDEGGEPKQFMKVGGVPMIVRSALAFEASSDIHEIVVVTREADIGGCTAILRKAGITKLTKVVAGGKTRQESAKLGFDAVNPECGFVAIHDAARCLVTPAMIGDVMEAAYIHGAAACASRVVDSMKRTAPSGIIEETVDRSNMWLVQTPQVFLANMYRAAAYMAVRENFVGTDDCVLCERLGFKVQLVDTGRFNIKVTYPEDLILAEMITAYRDKTAKTTEKTPI